MKINFLGTSHGVPAADRYCQSILIESGGALYLIDAGAPVIDLLLRNSYDLTALKAVFITHCHGDHLHGLIPLADLAGWKFKDMSFDMFLPEQKVTDAMVNYIECAEGSNNLGNERLRLNLVKEGVIFEDENIKITAYPTRHLEWAGRPAYGYLVEAEGKRVYISGDLNHALIDYPAIANEEELDAFVVECAHFPAEKLIANLKDTKAKQVMVVHVFPLEKYDVLKAYVNEAPFELIFPGDGDSFEI